MFERLRAKRLQKEFAKVVSPELLAKLLAERNDDLELTRGPIEYLLIAVRGESPEVVAQRMEAAMEVVIRHGARVDSLVSGLVVALLGAPSPVFDDQVDAEGLVLELRQALGDNARSVHRIEPGYFGKRWAVRNAASSASSCRASWRRWPN